MFPILVPSLTLGLFSGSKGVGTGPPLGCGAEGPTADELSARVPQPVEGGFLPGPSQHRPGG